MGSFASESIKCAIRSKPTVVRNRGEKSKVRIFISFSKRHVRLGRHMADPVPHNPSPLWALGIVYRLECDGEIQEVSVNQIVSNFRRNLSRILL